ncbi:MAG: DUF2339 domain-containing protein, partial [Blastocatellia bacterium]
LIFATLGIFHNIVNRKPTTRWDLSLIFSNAMLYFGTIYGLLNERYHGFLGLFAVIISAFYLGYGYIAYQRNRADRYLIYSFIGLATLFLTLAIPIQLDYQWVTMGWAIEGAVLTWIGLRGDSAATRRSGLLMFGIATWHWFAVDLPDFGGRGGQTFTAVFNTRAAAIVVLIAALAIAARFYRRLGEIAAGERTQLAELLLLGANALAVSWLCLDAHDYFQSRQLAYYNRSEKEPVYAALSLLEGATRWLSLVFITAVYGAIALFAGTRWRMTLIRHFAVVLLSGAGVYWLFLGAQYYEAAWHTLFFSRLFAAFLLTMGASVFGAWCYRGAGPAETEFETDERRVATTVLISMATLLTVAALSFEVLGYFAARAAAVTEVENPDNVAAIRQQIDSGRQFWLTLVWTVSGALILFAGFRRGIALARMGALGLISLATAKVLFADSMYYDAPWHSLVFNYVFGAFTLIAAALALALRLYKKADSADVPEKETLTPLLLIAGNAMAVIGLSLESQGYFHVRTSAARDQEQWQNMALARQLSLSVIWALYGGGMLIVGLARDNRLLRMLGLGLLAVTILKVFVIDLQSLDVVYRILSFIVLGAVLLVVSFLYNKTMKQKPVTRE